MLKPKRCDHFAIDCIPAVFQYIDNIFVFEIEITITSNTNILLLWLK